MTDGPQEAGGLPWSSVAEPRSLASSTLAQSLHPPSPHSGLAIDGPFPAVRKGLTLIHTPLSQLDPRKACHLGAAAHDGSSESTRDAMSLEALLLGLASCLWAV